MRWIQKGLGLEVICLELGMIIKWIPGAALHLLHLSPSLQEGLTLLTGNFPLPFPDFLCWGIPTGNSSNQKIRGLVGSLGNVKQMIIGSAFAQNIIIIFVQRYPNNSHASISLKYLSSITLTLFEFLPSSWCCDTYGQHIDAINWPWAAQAMSRSLYSVQKVSSHLASLGRRRGPLHFLKSISIAIWELT